MTSSNTPSKPFSILECISELGWFSLLFALLVGGPSVLALLQSVVVEHRLVDGLQWIVDGYNGIISVVGALFEPLLMPVVRWIGSLLRIDLQLHPHWRPLFVLVMVFFVSLARAWWNSKAPWQATFFILSGGLGGLVGSVVAGLFPLNASWWAQGAAAGLPILCAVFVIGVSYMLRELPAGIGRAFGDNIPPASAIGAIGGTIAFVAAVIVGLLPVLSQGAGVVGLAIVIFGAGVASVFWGAARKHAFTVRVGFTVLGGFIAAAIILAADQALKIAGAG